MNLPAQDRLRLVTFLCLSLLPVCLVTSCRADEASAGAPVTAANEMTIDFDDVPPGTAPRGWNVWIKDGKGQVASDAAGYEGQGSLKFSGVEVASAQRDFPVRSGEVVNLEVLVRGSGAGTPAFMVYSLGADNNANPNAGTYKGRFTGFEGEWRRAKVRSLIPQGVAALRVVLSVEKQSSPQDAVWFDRFKIMKEPAASPAAHLPGNPAPRVQVQFSEADNILPISNRDTFNMLRMVSVKHSDVEGSEVAKWVTPETARAYARNLRAAGYNMVLTEGQRYLMGDAAEHAPYPDVLNGSLPFPRLVENTKAIADAFHGEGLKVFLHLTAGAAPPDLHQRHPDWMAISVNDGQPHPVWGLEWLCINNPDFQEEYFKRLGELVRQSKADGLMVDETTLMFDTCGCKFCRAKFAADTHLEMPPQGAPWFGDLSNPTYKTFLQWRLKVCTDFNDKIRSVLREHVKDGELITYYAMPLNPTAMADHGITQETAGKVSHPLGFEMISNYSKYWAIYIANMKFVRAVAEQSDGDIFSISNPPSYDGIYQNWIMNLSQGAHQYWPWYVSDTVKEERKPLVQWEAVNRNSLAGLRAEADTAVVISSRNNNLHQHPLGSINLHNSFLAVCNTLTMAQIPYRALGDKDLNQPLRGKAKTIIALNLSLISVKQAENLRSFVNDGGTLVTSTDFSLYDENGNLRKNFALSDIMGCDYVSTIKEDGVLALEKAIPLLGNVTGRFPNQEFVIKVKPHQGTAQLGTARLPNGGPLPGVLSRTVGKGRVVYFASPLEPMLFFNEVQGNQILSRSYQEKRDEQFEKLFLSLVRNTAKEKITVANLPKGVVLETYRHNYHGQSGVVVSLSNFTGMLTEGRPETQSTGYYDIAASLPHPAKPIRITWRGQAKRAYAIAPDIPGKKELPLVKGRDSVSVNLPAFGNLIMVYFE